jgi:hypothetical protein
MEWNESLRTGTSARKRGLDRINDCWDWLAVLSSSMANNHKGTRRSGSADLPLHYGTVPKWLATRMATLGGVMTQAIVHHYGRDEFLRRLANPFWFQSFGAVMGMAWHSSGITTSVIGALKRGLAPMANELGLRVCGGRGKHSRATPQELVSIGEKVGFDGTAMAQTSRLVAKIDSAAIQDGFDLYLHGFIIADDGKWTVVQQGMNGGSRQARRYHWLSEGVKDFVEDPHSAIEGPNQGNIINLTDHRAADSRQKQLDILGSVSPEALVAKYNVLQPRKEPEPEAQGVLPYLIMPSHHDVRAEDIVSRRLHASIAAAAENGPADFPHLLLIPGVGPRTVRALALVAEVMHGTPCRFSDPARFSLAHGGKDRHPFPVPVKVYDETIAVLKSSVQKAKLGREEELSALKRLDDQARKLERHATGSPLSAIVEEEYANSSDYGGRSVFGWEPPKANLLKKIS